MDEAYSSHRAIVTVFMYVWSSTCARRFVDDLQSRFRAPSQSEKSLFRVVVEHHDMHEGCLKLSFCRHAPSA